ncbi:pentatricopeptide repeat-containing protein At4g02750-like [Macadamia integrifolia]|uniref:pentatricopeptide repeat-containing protein At4g02750-like n=1 Tax=Macadamia integrifolia TaxID=60698 RepID=UPI001C4EEA9B|nr:pentatricopeptide repeat-containing protein At4g02750-like [Macadamia integrifolia]
MYAKCGETDDGRRVFDTMSNRDLVYWTAMITAYEQSEHPKESLILFREIQEEGLSPDSVTMVYGVNPNPVTLSIAVSACAYIGSLRLGRKLHGFIINIRMVIDTTLWNAIIDMYAKCGHLDSAVHMFNNSSSSQKNVSSWNSMIAGYGMHGYGKEALELYSQMIEEGFLPNHITFTSILSACSHAGLVNEGRKCFEDMKMLSVTPEVKHYACMVDMLGRAGLLQEALGLIKEMPLEPNDGVWGALLLACRIRGNTELGELAAKNLFDLEPDHSGYYVLMLNIYAASCKWQEVGKLRQDQSHPQIWEVNRKVEDLMVEMKMVGYVSDLSCVLHDVEEEDKEHILNYHSEKLVVAFGIMHINPGMPIQVTKNLRVCNDCHSTFKFISLAYQRKIIVRDTNRFHHFETGPCSCKDYW